VMLLALVSKELRETRAFAALALIFFAIYLSNLTGRGNPVLGVLVNIIPGMSAQPADIPFVEDSFGTMLFFIGGVLAITLGFRQSAWEPSQGTALYLLHLPLPRRAIILTKLLTGVGLLLLCTLLPIVIYAGWAAMPRTHPGPFEWTMTGPAFRTWLLLPLVYLGAFASGIRPARWFGSRLMPLLSVLFPAVFLYLVLYWLPFGLLLLCAVTAALVSVIL